VIITTSEPSHLIFSSYSYLSHPQEFHTVQIQKTKKNATALHTDYKYFLPTGREGGEEVGGEGRGGEKGTYYQTFISYFTS